MTLASVLTKPSMATDAPSIDWLARINSSIIDFRLPSDPPDIDPVIFTARILAYYQQLNARNQA